MSDGIVMRSVAEITERKRDDYYYDAEKSLKTFLEESVYEMNPENLVWEKSRTLTSQSSLSNSFTGIANISRLNDIRRINKYLESVNSVLDKGHYLLINLETKNSRKARLLNRFPRVISYPLYTLDFLLNRVIPKTKPTRSIYFKLTKGKNRVLTHTEALGRLKSCGFDIINSQRVGYKTYILAQKSDRPAYDMTPTYGAIVKLTRIGYKGKRIQLYKLRTMHPYSEYLQKYVYEKNGTVDGDKIVEDFRVTNWGKIFRKFWIDELPMLWNWMKRELKLVGVRPLSEHKFYTYPKYLQEKRVKVKPGLVPPFYADLPESPQEFYDTEEKYLDSYLQKPIRTDIKYFFNAMYNIFVKRARSG